MKSLNKSNNFVLYVIGFTLLLILSFVLIDKFALSATLDNDVEVEADSYLTYYLNVSYDGVDVNGVASDDTTIANVKSGEMNVEDKLPEGLTFMGFVTTADGSIGAYERGNTTKSCLGKVLDDTNEDVVDTGVWNSGNTEFTYHGLHYTKSDNTVRFKVKNLKAGCQLTVGIITKTPESVDNPVTSTIEKRRDFYNFGSIQEGILTVFSNVVHVFMGRSDIDLYTVSYQITGNTPTGILPPSNTSYPEGSVVGVSSPMDVEGYTFSGWTTTDTTVTDGSFTMPNKNVVFTGSFTEKPKYTVTYQIEGTIPEGYVVPSTKEYSEGQTVTIDSLSEGSVFDLYRFNGWTTTGVTIDDTDNTFKMPASNIVIKGSFEELKYKVRYAFYDTVLPPNSETLLPSEKEYKPKSKVTLENPLTVDGYKFLGWYKEDNFEMPFNDVTIYGEWKRVVGEFEPTITKEIVNPKESYKKGEKVEFKITISNPEDFDLTNVMVRENSEEASFKAGSNYNVESSHIAKIDSLPSNGSVILYSTYIIQEDTNSIIISEAEIVGANASNGYELKDKEYKDDVSFSIIKASPNVPKTLDSIYTYVIIGVISLIIVIILVYYLIKNKKNSK